MSKITAAPDGWYVALERDNRTGSIGESTTLVRIERRAWQDEVISAAEKSVYDLKPELESTRGWITDKPEGVAILDNGRTFVVNDNDGVEDGNGETWFLPLGSFRKLFRRAARTVGRRAQFLPRGASPGGMPRDR